MLDGIERLPVCSCLGSPRSSHRGQSGRLRCSPSLDIAVIGGRCPPWSSVARTPTAVPDVPKGIRVKAS